MHVLTYLKKLYAFNLKYGITSDLQVDKDNTVEDVMDCSQTTGGIVCDIDNGIATTLDELRDYYEKTGNKKMLKRLEGIGQG